MDHDMLLHPVIPKNQKLKPKYTQSNLKRWSQGLVDENRRRRQAGDHRLSLDEYIDQIHGIVTKPAPKPQPKYTEPQSYNTQRSYELRQYRSLDSYNVGGCERKEPKQYSGERRLLGIATMHKSNMVPVFDAESAKEIAQMRRN